MLDAAPSPASLNGFSFTGDIGEIEGSRLASATITATAIPDLDLSDTPMAPLPPAVVAGPIGLATATWLAWRAKRRGGRI
jgi:hypothetical protein